MASTAGCCPAPRSFSERKSAGTLAVNLTSPLRVSTSERSRQSIRTYTAIPHFRSNRSEVASQYNGPMPLLLFSFLVRLVQHAGQIAAPEHVHQRPGFRSAFRQMKYIASTAADVLHPVFPTVTSAPIVSTGMPSSGDSRFFDGAVVMRWYSPFPSPCTNARRGGARQSSVIRCVPARRHPDSTCTCSRRLRGLGR